MRLKLAGADRLNGSGVFVPWRAQTFVNFTCAGGQLARSLKRHPLGGTTVGESLLLEPKTDPIVLALDRVVRSPKITSTINATLKRVIDVLNAGTGAMAWDTIPLDVFQPSLPPEVKSCWIFVIRPGQATGAERHPNSHQRSLSLQGTGRFELREAGAWEPHELSTQATAPVGRRWVTIPPNTWHRLFSGSTPWGMISFHTVPPEQLVEERPVSESDLEKGPTSRRFYAAQEDV